MLTDGWHWVHSDSAGPVHWLQFIAQDAQVPGVTINSPTSQVLSQEWSNLRCLPDGQTVQSFLLEPSH